MAALGAEGAAVGQAKEGYCMRYLIVVFIAFGLVATAQDQPNMGRAVEGATMIRDRMRDPDSFVVDRVYYWTNHKDRERYCYQYRARNGFGGMNRGAAYLSIKTKKDGSTKVDVYDQTGLAMFQRSGVCDSKHDGEDITTQYQAAQ